MRKATILSNGGGPLSTVTVRHLTLWNSVARKECWATVYRWTSWLHILEDFKQREEQKQKRQPIPWAFHMNRPKNVFHFKNLPLCTWLILQWKLKYWEAKENDLYDYKKRKGGWNRGPGLCLVQFNWYIIFSAFSLSYSSFVHIKILQKEF